MNRATEEHYWRRANDDKLRLPRSSVFRETRYASSLLVSSPPVLIVRNDLLRQRNLRDALQERLRRLPQNERAGIGVEHVRHAHHRTRSCVGKSSMPTMKSSLARKVNAKNSDQSLGRGDSTMSAPTLRIKTSRMLKITADLSIDDTELSEQFVRASGPGGQNVN